MNIIGKPVDMIGWFDEKGRLKPARYRLQESRDEHIKIKIGKVIEEREEKKGKKRIIVYRCQSIIDGFCKEYEIMYDVSECRWALKKFY